MQFFLFEGQAHSYLVLIWRDRPQKLPLETSQQGQPALRRYATHGLIVSSPGFRAALRERGMQPALAVVLGARSARQAIPASLALPAFLQSYIANLVMSGIRLIPLGQTDGQLVIAELERAILTASAQAQKATIRDLWICRIYGLSRLNGARNSIHQVVALMTFAANPELGNRSLGKTALVEALWTRLRDSYDTYVITNLVTPPARRSQHAGHRLFV